MKRKSKYLFAAKKQFAKSVPFCVGLCILMSTVLLHPVIATAGEIGDVSSSNLEEVEFTKAQDPQFFVAYVYVHDNLDNPYNNPNRDIVVEFGGDGEYYLNANYYNYADDYCYQNYGVVRITGYLPYKHEYAYMLALSTNDTNEQTLSYRTWNGKKEVDFVGNSLELKKEYNEFYLVGGSADWMKENGEQKYQELYTLFHSEEKSINANAAYEQAVDDEFYGYWQEQMTNDLTISAFEADDGKMVTREDMNEMGYPVPDGSGYETNTKSQAGIDTSAVSDEDTGVENTEVSESLQQDPGQEEVPQIPEEKTQSRGIPPIAIIIIVVVLAGAAFAIAWIRKEKNNSDLYVD